MTPIDVAIGAGSGGGGDASMFDIVFLSANDAALRAGAAVVQAAGEQERLQALMAVADVARSVA